MNEQLTLVTILLVLLIIVELVALYTNGFIVSRNYSIMKKENESLQKTNQSISRKYEEIAALLVKGDAIAGYMVDARGITYIKPDEYKRLTAVKDEDEGAE